MFFRYVSYQMCQRVTIAINDGDIDLIQGLKWEKQFGWLISG